MTVLTGQTCNEKKNNVDLLKTSPIHGFGFVGRSTSKVELVFWVILMVGCGGFLIYDTIQLTKQFWKQETTTKVEMQFNESITFPKTILCIAIPEADFGWKGSPYRNMSRSVAIVEAMEKYKTKEQFLKDKWDMVIYRTAYNYLNYTSTWEQGIQEVDLSQYRNGTMPEKMKAAEEFEKLTRAMGVTFDDVLHKVGNYTRRLIGLRVKIVRSRSDVTVIDKREHLTTYISHWVCYQMNVTKYTAEHESQFMAITGNLRKRVSENRWTKFRKVALYVGDRTKLRTKDPAKVMLGTNSWTEVEVKVDGHYKQLSGKKCSAKQQTVYECIEKCRAEIYKDMCHCYPATSFKFAAKTDRPCTMSDYFNHLKYDPQSLNECTRSCKHHCDRVQYSLERKQLTTQNDAMFWIKVLITKYEYPIFEEKYTKIWQNLLGDLGGTLGVYFGASILSIVHLAVYLIERGMERWGNSNAVEKLTSKIQLKPITADE